MREFEPNYDEKHLSGNNFEKLMIYIVSGFIKCHYFEVKYQKIMPLYQYAFIKIL